MRVEKINLTSFSNSPDEKPWELWELENSSGLKIRLSNFGPRILSLEFPNCNGDVKNLILGYNNQIGYQQDPFYQGQVAVGPYANRISDGYYIQPDHSHPSIEQNQKVLLESNDGNHTLHSADDNWSNKIWSVKEPFMSQDKVGICFELNKADFNPEGSFLAPKQVQVRIEINQKNEMKIRYHVDVEETMPINPTFHAYFNLNGIGTPDIKNHIVKSNSRKYLPVDGELIPTGELADVRGTVFDFVEPKKLSNALDKGGIDICYLFPEKEKEFSIWSPDSKIQLSFTSSLPAFQFYTGSFLNKPFKQFQGFCLEAQLPVDAVSNPHWMGEFGDPFLRPGDRYSHEANYHFQIKETFV